MLSLSSCSFVLLLFFVSIKATAAYAYQKPESCLALQIKEGIQIHCLRIYVKSLRLSCSYITDFLVFTGDSFLVLTYWRSSHEQEKTVEDSTSVHKLGRVPSFPEKGDGEPWEVRVKLGRVSAWKQ